MFDRYMQPKRAFSGGFTSTFALDASDTTQTLIEVKRTTPLYAPKKHEIRVQRVTVNITTGSAKTWTLRSATTHTVITPGMATTTAGLTYTYDFGPQGIAVDLNEDLEILISAAGAAGTVVIEGFQRMTATDLAAAFTLSPTSGDVHLDQSITITASEGTTFFEGDPTVTVDGVAATSVVRVSSSSITCVFPEVGHSGAGAVDVVITQPDGTVITKTNGFTWVESAYVLTSVTANSGAAAGGTTVTLVGYFFDTGVQVTFDGVAATAETPNVNGLSMTCVTPAHAAGAVDVVFLNLDGTTATLVNGFTYV